jgi:membrane protease YdiL (CAAX protease family)
MASAEWRGVQDLNPMSKLGRIAIPILVSATGISLAAAIGVLLGNGTIPTRAISENKEINFSFTLQVMVLVVSFAAVGFVYFFDKASFKTFFRLRASREKNEWNTLGPVLAVGFTLGTTMYMSFAVTSQHGVINGQFWKLLPLVLLFAATNAWSEEIVSRFVIVAGLHGKLSPSVICWISSLIFGVPHFFGTPSGPFGALMAGLMGWLLAKSMLETKSLGWALFIHFLQDLVIFGGGAMIIAGTPS